MGLTGKEWRQVITATLLVGVLGLGTLAAFVAYVVWSIVSGSWHAG